MASKKTNTLFLIAGAALLILLALHFFGTRGAGPEGFSSEGAPTFTMYYADWCPHCQEVKPDFTKFMRSGSIEVNKKTVFVEMIEAEKNPDKVKGKPVKGYPTFLLEKGDGSVVEYPGSRDEAGWMEWLQKNV
jgi:thiol-disulfide isomerase/thioredoxin